MVGVERPGVRVLEVASGTGTHAEIVATTMLSREGKPVYVMCDFSEAMVKMLAERFSKSDYVEIPGYKACIDVDTDYVTTRRRIDLDALVKA